MDTKPVVTLPCLLAHADNYFQNEVHVQFLASFFFCILETK